MDIPPMRTGPLGATIFTVGINQTADRKGAIIACTALLRALALRRPADLEVVIKEGCRRACCCAPVDTGARWRAT